MQEGEGLLTWALQVNGQILVDSYQAPQLVNYYILRILS